MLSTGMIVSKTRAEPVLTELAQRDELQRDEQQRDQLDGDKVFLIAFLTAARDPLGVLPPQANAAISYSTVGDSCVRNHADFFVVILHIKLIIIGSNNIYVTFIEFNNFKPIAARASLDCLVSSSLVD